MPALLRAEDEHARARHQSQFDDREKPRSELSVEVVQVGQLKPHTFPSQTQEKPPLPEKAEEADFTNLFSCSFLDAGFWKQFCWIAAPPCSQIRRDAPYQPLPGHSA